jgi:RNA-binding protein 8A
MVGVEVDAVDFEPEEEYLMDDDTTMDDGNVDVVPTPVPKLKSTITGGTSQLGDGGPKKNKGNVFREETDYEHNSHFVA